MIYDEKWYLSEFITPIVLNTLRDILTSGTSDSFTRCVTNFELWLELYNCLEHMYKLAYFHLAKWLSDIKTAFWNH